MTRRRRWLAAITTLLVLPVVPSLLPSAGADQQDVTLERRWSPYVQPTRMTLTRLEFDVRGRSAYVFSYAPDTQQLHVRTWDLDTFRPRTADYTEPFPALGGSTPILVDESHHAVVVAQKPASQTAVPGVEVLAPRGHALVRVGTPASRFPPGYAIVGLSVDTSRGRVYVLGEPTGGGVVPATPAAVGGVRLDVWDLASLSAGAVSSPYAQPITVPQQCGVVVANYTSAAILPSADGRAVYFGCITSRGSTSTSTGPSAWDFGGVAELDLAAAAAGTPTAMLMHPVAGDYGTGDTVALPRQHRLALVANHAGATSVKVFDATHDYYVGNVGIDDNFVAAFGVDPQRGAGYYVSSDGLGVFDLAAVPATQGVVYDYAAILGVLHRPVEVDPVTRRVFVASADDIQGGVAPYVLVFRDRTPPGAPDPVPGGGLQVPERPGITESRRNTDVSAVGAEFRWVGGPNTLIANWSHLDSRGLATKPGTRWERFAVVDDASLTNDAAVVNGAVTTVQDASTTTDLANSTFATAVACADFGYTPKQEPGDGVAAHCDLGQQIAEGSAVEEPPRVLVSAPGVGHPELVPAMVQVRHTSASASTKRTGLGPLASTARAEADGIDLLGVVQIGRVVATATTTVHGRTGTAATTYTRSISDVVVNGTPLCAGDCSFAQVQQAVNETFGGRVRIELPDPARRANADGTVAWVEDDAFRHVDRMTVDDVPFADVTVPAMEVVAYQDGLSPSRLVVSLAAISAHNGYSITRAEEPAPVPTVAPSTVAVQVPHTDTVASPPAPVPTAKQEVGTPVPVAGPANPVAVLRDGLRVVFRSPRRVAAIAAVWALLAVPVYLAARRRLLLEQPYLRRSVEGP